jgi:hypothetical protein
MPRLAALLAAFALAAPAAASEPDKGGFVPLFNGKDLDGWVSVNCHPSTFFVKDGVIITTGHPTGFLRTAKQYENFELELEWMHVEKEKMANSGLFVWGDPLPAVGTPYTRGIEVQILANYETDWATSHGDVFSIHGARCKPDRPHPKGYERCLPSERRCKPAGEWNHYKVIANDGAIKLHVNGKEVSGVSECTPRKGYLALEAEGAECHFRNIRIKELPSTNPSPEQVAKVAEGHRSLFTGLDLAGWKTEEGAWKAAGGILRAAGKADLVSEEQFSRFELIFDCRMPAKAKKGDWSVEFGTSQAHQMTNLGIDFPGRWNRVAVTVDGNGVSQMLNGRQGAKTSFVPDAGPIRFKPAEGLELMNIFVRELK